MNGHFGGRRNNAHHQGGGPQGYGGYDNGGMHGMGQSMGSGQPGIGSARTNTNLNDVEQYLDSFHAKTNDAKRKQKVCVHWLKKVCRKGDGCEYLHCYIEEKIPICRFFKERGHCDQQETCVYRHPTQKDDPGASKKQEQCPYHERGFCKLGKHECTYWHGAEDKLQRVCVNYALGFCPDGPKCRYTHVKTMISP